MKRDTDKSRGKRANRGSDRRGSAAVKDAPTPIGRFLRGARAFDYGAGSRYLLGATLRHSQKLRPRPAL
jgi:hypothetical protein